MWAASCSKRRGMGVAACGAAAATAITCWRSPAFAALQKQPLVAAGLLRGSAAALGATVPERAASGCALAAQPAAAAIAACALAAALSGAASAAPRPRRQRRGTTALRAEQEPEVDPRRQDPPPQAPPVQMPVISTEAGGKLDVMSKLLEDRVIICCGEVKDEMAQVLIAQMLYLSSENPDADITMYINSPGGSVSAGMAIYDTMQFIPCDVKTVCFGLAASMGSFLLSAGTKGKRTSLPNSRIMIHQPLGGAQGQATDVRIQAREILHMRLILNQHLADATGKTEQQILEDCDRDNFMTPEEAKEYGLIDDIIKTKSWPRIEKPPRPAL